MSRHADDGVATVTAGTSHRSGSDMRAAFMGLILGSLVLLALVFTVVKLTARSFEGHGAAPAAGGEQHAPPAAAPPETGAPPTTPPPVH
jgi:hypothetical protein